MKTNCIHFNLNNYILIQITDYGWKQLEKRYVTNPGFIEHCIKAKKKVVNDKEYYRLQAHFVMETFGELITGSIPTPVLPEILMESDAVSNASALALEFGYKQCEKGENIQAAFINYNKVLNG